jgi:ankyrin repeat protein
MPPTLSTLPAEIIYEIADCLALPELNALLQTSRLFYQQLNHTLHKCGLAMARPTHRHQEGKHDFCQEKHVQCFVFSPTLQSARYRLALGFNEPWLHPSANIVAWLGAGLDPNACITRTRGTLLHRAVEMKDEETVAHLLACGADVNAHTRYGMTPLHFAFLGLKAATINAASAVASALLKGGADPKCADDVGETPLHHAVRRCGSLYYKGEVAETVKKMMEETVKVLVEGGALVGQPDHKGLTPREIALRDWPRPFYRKVFGTGEEEWGRPRGE